MVSFYEVMTNSQQTNYADVCEFNQKINNAYVTIENYKNNDIVNQYEIEFENYNQQKNEFTQKLQQPRMRTPEVELEEHFYQERLNNLQTTLYQRSLEILHSFESVLTSLDDAVNILNDKLLAKWKHNQILFVFGEGSKLRTEKMQKKFDELKSQLNEIQKHFENLFLYIQFTHTLLSVIHDCYRQQNFDDPTQVKFLERIIQKLILSSFVIVEQPRQVIHFKVK